MPAITQIGKTSLPDPESWPIEVRSNDGETVIGSLVNDGKGSTTLQYAAGQLPHRTYPLKKKHRAN
jgi:hypothetical protein